MIRLAIKITVYQFVPEDQGEAGIGEWKTKAEDRPNAPVGTSDPKCTIQRGASHYEAELIYFAFMRGNIYVLFPVEARIIVLWRTVASMHFFTNI
ncbi:hypothetical protein T4B_10776 [Trichinella pseudospiralis]|uniref:Uncharacterized protein n=2 Tax=Trichinella pseudospiralis TaxID=6337 RepID=A0A0V1EEE5_TRIPS|nr:hypothetical protein T4A_8011 [Trichinella pseudospiralis]KRY84321.1 hypothetical protein T4D_15182 [Trichinella pseudospiralis]KRZ18251.1 hypothetical protein T4B_10776 [Trichinella pseudospiralis]